MNREVRSLYDDRPSFGQSRWPLRLQEGVILESTTDVYTATGTKNIPILSDTNDTLTEKDIFRLITNDTDHHRVISASGITDVILAAPLTIATTTASKWTAYKDTYALPANCGDIDKICYESGETDVVLADSRAMFAEVMETEWNEGMPIYACIGFFTNRWADYHPLCLP